MARTTPYWAGTAVISPAGMALMAVYAIPSMFLSNPDLDGHIGIRLLISLVALGLLFAMLWIARLTWLTRADREYQPVRIVVTFVATSLLRAIAVALLFEATGVTEGINWTQRLLPSVIGFSTALLIVNAVVGSVVEHRRREQLLAHQQLAARQARDIVLTRIDADLQATAEQIRAEMLTRIQHLSAHDPQAAAQALRDAADHVLRPVTRALLADGRTADLVREPAPNRRIRVRLSGLIVSATKGRPLLPVWTAVLVMAFGGPYVLSVLPLGTALYVLAVGFALIWLVLFAANAGLARALPPRGPRGRMAILICVVLVAAAVVAASTPIVLSGPQEVVRRIMLGDLFLIPEMALALVIARAAQLQRDGVLQQLADTTELVEWQLARARCLLWYDQRALARAMHGPVQSALASAVLRLEAADRQGLADDAFIASAQTEIISSLDALKLDTPQAAGPDSALAELAGTWVGVCEITWDVSPQVSERLGHDPLGSATVSELATEAAWNAIRHANASRVHVRIEDDGPRAMQLTVTNDGPAAHDPQPGLGTRMLDDMTLNWNLSRAEDTTVLTARVPVT